MNLNYTGKALPRPLSVTLWGLFVFSLPVSPRAYPVLYNEYLIHTLRHVYTACNSTGRVILRHSPRHVCQSICLCMYVCLCVCIHACIRVPFHANSHPLFSIISEVCSLRGRTPASFFSSAILDKTIEVVEVFGYTQEQSKE